MWEWIHFGDCQNARCWTITINCFLPTTRVPIRSIVFSHSHRLCMWLVTFSVACTITYQHKMHLVDGVTLTWLSDDGSTKLHMHYEHSEYVQGTRQHRSQRETSANIWIYVKPFCQSDFTYTGWTISRGHVNFMFHMKVIREQKQRNFWRVILRTNSQVHFIFCSFSTINFANYHPYQIQFLRSKLIFAGVSLEIIQAYPLAVYSQL